MLFPPVTSGPIVGKGCVVVAEQFVGKVVHAVQTFHHDSPVPPLGWALTPRKNDAGKLVDDGTELENADALPESEVGTSDLLPQVVDHPGSLELPHQRTALVTVS